MSLTRFLLPDPCLACGRAAAGAGLGLCLPCRGLLRELANASLCGGCARALAAVELPMGFLCGACRARPPAFDALAAAFAYAPPLDAVVGGLKFRRLEYLGDAVAQALWRLLEAALGGHDLVVAVPLHWRRRLARGFNQAQAIAAPLARSAGLELVAALRRRRSTVAQARLPRDQRLRNPRRAFKVTRQAEVRGARVLLVDDVVTTGATVHAAALALKQAGASRVTVVALARTLEEGPWRDR